MSAVFPNGINPLLGYEYYNSFVAGAASAIGNGATADFISVAVGSAANASNGAIVIGSNASSAFPQTVVLGNGAIATAAGQIAINQSGNAGATVNGFFVQPTLASLAAGAGPSTVLGFGSTTGQIGPMPNSQAVFLPSGVPTVALGGSVKLLVYNTATGLIGPTNSAVETVWTQNQDAGGFRLVNTAGITSTSSTSPMQVGFGSIAAGNNSFVLGNNSQTGAANQVILGSGITGNNVAFSVYLPTSIPEQDLGAGIKVLSYNSTTGLIGPATLSGVQPVWTANQDAGGNNLYDCTAVKPPTSSSPMLFGFGTTPAQANTFILGNGSTAGSTGQIILGSGLTAGTVANGLYVNSILPSVTAVNPTLVVLGSDGQIGPAPNASSVFLPTNIPAATIGGNVKFLAYNSASGLIGPTTSPDQAAWTTDQDAGLHSLVDLTRLGFGATGTGDIIIGDASATTSGTAGSQIAIGEFTNASGNSVAVGASAIAASQSVAIGYYAGSAQSISTSVGFQSGSTAGGSFVNSGNTLFGNNTGQSLSAASGNNLNVLLGYLAGYQGTASNNNVFIGAQAASITANLGSQNVGLGTNCLPALAGGTQNVTVGVNSGTPLTSGSNNVLLGFNSGLVLTSGANNVLIGSGAGLGATFGATSSGVAVGVNATVANGSVAVGASSISNGTSSVAIGNAATSDSVANSVAVGASASTLSAQSVAIGSGAAAGANSSGDNVCIGYLAGNTTFGSGANQSVFIGSNAGHALTTGALNVGIGYHSLQNCTTGHQNTCFGGGTGASITTGAVNTFVGQAAGQLQTTGDQNTAIGAACLSNGNSTLNTAVGAFCANNITGAQNVFIGQGIAGGTTTNNCVIIGQGTAGAWTTGNNCTVVGQGAAASLTTGTRMTIIGTSANCTAGDSDSVCIGNGASCQTQNVCIGSGAKAINGCTFIGYNSGHNQTSASLNVALGWNTLVAASGNQNVAIGNSALQGFTGSRTTAIGYQTGDGVNSSNDSVYLGNQAGDSVTTGSNNTLVGASSGTVVTTGALNTMVGYNTNVTVATQGANTILGANAVANGTSTIVLGTAAVGGTTTGAMYLPTTGGGGATLADIPLTANCKYLAYDTTTGQLGKRKRNDGVWAQNVLVVGNATTGSALTVDSYHQGYTYYNPSSISTTDIVETVSYPYDVYLTGFSVVCPIKLYTTAATTATFAFDIGDIATSTPTFGSAAATMSATRVYRAGTIYAQNAASTYTVGVTNVNSNTCALYIPAYQAAFTPVPISAHTPIVVRCRSTFSNLSHITSTYASDYQPYFDVQLMFSQGPLVYDFP